MLRCLSFMMSVLGLWLLFTAPTSLSAAVYRLKPALEVTQAQIYVADLLVAEDVAAAFSKLPVQQLAGIGPYTINAQRVYQVLRQHGLYQNGDQIVGSTVITWKQVEISSDELLAAVRTDIHTRLGQDKVATEAIEMTVEKRPQALMVAQDLDTPYNLSLEPLQNILYGRVPYRIRVLRGQREIGRSMVIMDVGVHKTISVARRDLERGQVLGVGDVQERAVLVNSRNQAAGLISLKDVVGSVVRQRIRAEAPIYDYMVRKPFAVKGGQIVEMIYHEPAFQISLRGRATGNAAIGEAVTVQGVDGGQLLHGQVIAAGQVLIQ